MREDLFELIAHAGSLGIRAIISTNGTLITKDLARKIREAGADYVGVSLDGIGEANDRFRGTRGAFDLALAGIRNLIETGMRVGIRFTLTRHNRDDLPGIFDLAEREGVTRICVYHLVYTGRGSRMEEDDLARTEVRRSVDLICERAAALAGQGVEVLTVDNHADGAYLCLMLKTRDPARAEEAMRLLRLNGGNSSGAGIACVDSTGDVHPDQFWRGCTLGSVRERAFGEIWTDPSNELLRLLRDRKHCLKGRCARCRFLDICNGNLRARAEAIHGDMWREDPACYLTDFEIQ
jgi:radical SAM protein with 4Fe4S-binding SPASM domain